MSQEIKWNIQESRYKYPYHYIPFVDKDGYANRIRILKWGFEYLCYQYHIIEIIDKIYPNSILDVGCGDGFFLSILRDRPYEKLGVDLSDTAVNLARAISPGITFLNKDAAEIDREFDVVTAIEVLEHISDDNISDFLTTLYSRTKLNGYTILSVPTTNLPLNPKHYRHYNIDIFKKQLKDSGVDYRIEYYEYIFKINYLYKKYLKFTQNRFWIFEPHFLRKMMWKYVWNSLRFANENNGSHLVIKLKKV